MISQKIVGLIVALVLVFMPASRSQVTVAAGVPLSERYEKREVMIPMRDGVRLFTSIYSPVSAAEPRPILMRRTPYSCAPYGENEYPRSLGPSEHFVNAGYIIVFQDVRGTWRSEGEFVNVRPQRPQLVDRDFDESTDTYDTIEWLTRNVPANNGRVGLWGISYPGFYAALGMVNAHPALKASSPQAPIADWFFDDFRHNGAFFLAHSFWFLSSFGQVRSGPTSERPAALIPRAADGYSFFLQMGSLANADKVFFKGRIPYWNELLSRPNRDEYWQERSTLPHLKNVAPAVLTVGGWFDAEDLYGPLKTYDAVEKQNPQVENSLVMGPWQHGGWARADGDRLGGIHFGSATSRHYRDKIEFPFFERHLRGRVVAPFAEATMFETGTNQWRRFDRWPPKNVDEDVFYLAPSGELSSLEPESRGVLAEFVSDPARPVPHTAAITSGMNVEYMTEDQRFAARRPDVAVFCSDVIKTSKTVVGSLDVELWVSTSAADADWIVKLIDVYPEDSRRAPDDLDVQPIAGYQMMVRSEVIRGRYRESLVTPRSFVSDVPTRVRLELLDVLHTFRPGHRVMIQIQSTWFPLVDRNPQTWVSHIPDARPEDFRAAVHRVWSMPGQRSKLKFNTLAE